MSRQCKVHSSCVENCGAGVCAFRFNVVMTSKIAFLASSASCPARFRRVEAVVPAVDYHLADGATNHHCGRDSWHAELQRQRGVPGHHRATRPDQIMRRIGGHPKFRRVQKRHNQIHRTRPEEIGSIIGTDNWNLPHGPDLLDASQPANTESSIEASQGRRQFRGRTVHPARAGLIYQPRTPAEHPGSAGPSRDSNPAADRRISGPTETSFPDMGGLFDRSDWYECFPAYTLGTQVTPSWSSYVLH